MKIESKLIKDLKPATYNPRQISTKQYKDLKESIKKFSLVDPIIVNKDNTVIGGHQRLKICKELKHIEIDCVVLDLSKEEERELNIRLNKNTGTFDMDILANEFDIDELVDWGFKHIDLDINIDKIGGNIEDDHIPEVKESRVKLGDVWQLGKHRLMCGDSTKESDVEKLMNGEKADMVFTDPPFTSDRRISRKKDNLQIDMISESIEKIHNLDYTDILFKNCEGVILIMGGAVNTVKVSAKHIDNFKWFYIIYHKQPYLTFNVKTPIIHTFYIAHFNSSKNNLRKLPVIQEIGNYKDRSVKEHKYSKKQEVLIPYIENISSKGDIVLDVFLGSGSILIACEKTNRVCYGMELDTKYCDVIIERWEQFTGQKATKL